MSRDELKSALFQAIVRNNFQYSKEERNSLYQGVVHIINSQDRRIAELKCRIDFLTTISTSPFNSTTHPLPWSLGYFDQFMGHGFYVVLDRNGKLVINDLERNEAEQIVEVINLYNIS